MTFKTRKIKNIDKSICTVEQKLAYNIAFRIYINHETEYKKIPTESAKAEAREKLTRLYLKSIDSEKYNHDVIFAALNAGLEKYLNKNFIACNYEEVGEAFPINYQII